MIGTDYAEYRCTACKKEVKNIVLQCSKCIKSFYHSGCASKHRTLKGNEVVKCEGPFIEITIDNEKAEMRKSTVSGRERLGSTGSIRSTAAASGGSKQLNMDTDWIKDIMKEMKDEIVQACRNEIKNIVKQTIREELVNIRRELEDMKQNTRKYYGNRRSGQKSYSDTVKEKKESIYSNCETKERTRERNHQESGERKSGH